MAITTISLSDTFDVWRVSFNETASTVNAQIVPAVLGSLTTTEKTTLVGAINELVSTKANKTGDTFSGDQIFSGNVTISGSVILADGSAGTPSMRFQNDPDAGLYWKNTSGGMVALSVGGGDVATYTNAEIVFNKRLTFGTGVSGMTVPSNFFIDATGNFAIRDSSSNIIISSTGVGTDMVDNAAIKTGSIRYSKLDGKQAPDQIAVSGSIALDNSLGDWFKIAPNGNISISVTNMPAGKLASMIVECVNFGAYTISWPVGIKWQDGVGPAMSASGTDIIGIIKDGNNNLYGTVISVGVA